MKYVLKSEANWVKILVFNCISEHFSFFHTLFQNTIINMGPRPEIMINTGRNSLNTECNCLFFSKVVLIFAFKNSHRLERSWTHSGERKIRVTKKIDTKDTFPQRWSYISENLKRRLLPRSSKLQGNLGIGKAILMLKQQMNWLEFAFRCSVFEVPSWKIETSLRIVCLQQYLHRSSKCLEQCNGFSHSSSQQQLILQWLLYQQRGRLLHYIWRHRW